MVTPGLNESQLLVDLDVIERALKDVTPAAKPLILMRRRARRIGRDVREKQQLRDRILVVRNALLRATGDDPDAQTHHQWLGRFNAYYLAELLVERSSLSGAERALNVLKYILSNPKTAISYRGVIFGLSLPSQVTFSNGITLLPLAQLPRTGETRRRLSGFGRWFHGEGIPIPHCAFVAPTWEGLGDGHAYRQHVQTSWRNAREVVNALTMFDRCAPFIHRAWIEFGNEILQSLRGGGSNADTGDGVNHTSHPPVPFSSEWIEDIEMYLGLPPEAKEKLWMPIRRLRMARHRFQTTDCVIDCGIALEALLYVGTEGSISAALRDGAVELIGENYEGAAVRRLVSEFYSIRGRAVHGRSSSKPLDSRDVIERTLRLAGALIRASVRNGVRRESH